MTTLYTFGDSILDCGRYNDLGVMPGDLIVRNDDRLFPEFRGRDLSSRGPARVEHRAQDGATVGDLPPQARNLVVEEPSLALVTIGGNDFLGGVYRSRDDIEQFANLLAGFLARLPIRPIYVGNVYDPTLGDDTRNFLAIDPHVARQAFQFLNRSIARVAASAGATLVDLHAHFLTGDLSWFVSTIEPSLIGASEIRRCFLEAIEAG